MQGQASQRREEIKEHSINDAKRGEEQRIRNFKSNDVYAIFRTHRGGELGRQESSKLKNCFIFLQP